MKEKIKKEIIKRLLSFCLVLAMIFSGLTGAVPSFASSNTDGISQTQEVSADSENTVSDDKNSDSSQKQSIEEEQEVNENDSEQEDDNQEAMEESGNEGIMLMSEDDGDISSSIDISGYSNALNIYNYNTYTDADGNIQSQAGTFNLKGSKTSLDINVGDHPVEGNEVTRARKNDIQIDFNGIILNGGTMYFYPVYTDVNNYYTVLSIAEGSTLNDIVLEDNAKVNLILTAGLTVNSITLGEGAELNITLSGGSLTVTGDISGDVTGDSDPAVLAASKGVLSVNESGTGGTLKAGNISVGTLTISGGTVETCDGKGKLTGKIQGWDSVSVSGGVVQNTAFFGYSSSDDKTMTFTGGTVSNVTTVGHASDFSGTFTLSGADAAAFSDCSVYCDYPINYYHNGVELKDLKDAPVSYRVKFTNGVSEDNASTIGYHTSSGYTALTDGEAVTLPDYGENGYAFKGWVPEGQEDTMTALPATKQMGALTLSAKMNANSVAVSYDLGYTPTDKTNEKDAEDKLPSEITTADATVGKTITLPEQPVRFGYDFQGWKITSGSHIRTLQTDATELKVAYADLTDEGALTLEAQWKAREYSVQMAGSPDIETENQMISIDGGSTWQTFSDLAETYSVTYSVQGKTPVLSFAVSYGQTMGDLLHSVFGEESNFPIVKDKDSAQHFVNWNINGAEVTASSVFDNSDEIGMLKAKDGETLSTFDSRLKDTPTSITSAWNTKFENILTTDTSSAWTILVDGSAVTPDEDGKVTVNDGSVVTYRTSATSPASIALWNFVDSAGNTIYPEMQAVTAASQYIDYQFTMTGINVTASYYAGKEVYVNIADSAITFAENVSYNGRTGISGFWYQEKMVKSVYDNGTSGDTSDDLTVNVMTPLFGADDTAGTNSRSVSQNPTWYFYEFDATTQNFYVTSCNVETQKQLTLVNKTQGLYLQACKLMATSEYSSKLNGTSGLVATASKVNTFANIIVDNQTNTQYTTNIKIKGSNTVACIGNTVFTNDSNYMSSLNITGEGTDPTLYAGLIYGCFNTTIENLNYSEYTSEKYPDNYEYAGLFFYNDQGLEFTFSNCKVDLPNKAVVDCMNFIISNGSTATLKYVKSRQGVEMSDRSNAYIAGDLTTLGRGNFRLSYSSKLVVGGSITASGYDRWGKTDSIENNSILVVKGAYCECKGLKMTSGLLVCNVLCCNEYTSLSGGVLVANQISNYITKKNVYTLKAAANGDSSEYDQYFCHAEYPNTYKYDSFNITGTAKVFLFGTYTGSSGSYNTDYTADTAGNPVKTVLASVLNSDGTGVGTTSLDCTKLEESISAVTTTHECFLWGDSEKNLSTDVKYRTVNISGSAEIYAAGKLTFNNDTVISGGTVNSNQWVAGKNTLTISGGTVTAPQVGNCCNITHTEDGLKHWSLLNLNGGTVNADSIGTVFRTDDSTTDRSTIVIGSGAKVTVKDGTTVGDDLYINYVCPDGFTNPNTVDNLHLTGTQSAASMSELPELTMTEQTFDKPTYTGAGTSQSGSWGYGSLSGKEVSVISASGKVNDIKSKTPVYLANTEEGNTGTYVSLYARIESYTLTLSSNNTGKDTYSCTSASYEDNGVSTAFAFTADYPTQSVKAGDTVTLKVPAGMAKKVVVWYYDGNGILHNAFPTQGEDGVTVTFTMPYANTEVWITDELVIYHDESAISLTSDGFALETPESESGTARRRDSEFSYAGDLKIAMKGSASTTNKIYFEPGCSAELEERTITYSNLKEAIDNVEFGTKLINGSSASINNVTITLEGDNSLVPILCPYLTALNLTGKDTVDPTNNRLTITPGPRYTQIYSTDSSCTYTGKVSFNNLYLLNKFTGPSQLVYNSRTKNNNPVSFNNCRIYSGAYARFTVNVNDVTMDKCIWLNDGLNQYNTLPAFTSAQNVTISNSTCSFKYGSNDRDSYAFYHTISKSLTITNSTIYNGYVSGTEGCNEVYSEAAPTITLDHSNWLQLGRTRLRELSLTNGSTFIVGSGSYDESSGNFDSKYGNDILTLTERDGYLLSSAISVGTGSELYAGYVVCSGYNTSAVANQSAFDSYTGSYLNGKSYSGITVNGGTINATEFVGGDLNGKVTVNSGSINAPAIGTAGIYFGYPKVVPSGTSAGPYVYKKTTIPTACTVTIKGGEVNVSGNGYLGGMNAVVNQTGGTVNLADGAVYGLTDDQMTTLKNSYSSNGLDIAAYKTKNINVNITGGTVTAAGSSSTGSINAPYGTVTVSEAAGADTKLSVYNMKAENGSISISNAADGYDNPYTGSESDKATKVGVIVSNELSAQDLSILDGAQVYAKAAWSTATAGTNGSLTVGENDSSATQHTSVYTDTSGGSFGINGSGDITLTTVHKQSENGKKQNVYGSARVQIQYVLNDDSTDEAANSDKNPDSFVVGQTSGGDCKYATEGGQTYIVLQDPTRYGFKFEGWYENEDFRGEKVSRILTANSSDLVLYAKWKAKTVTFSMKVSSTELGAIAEEVERNGIDGTWDETAQEFTFNETVSIPYREAIQGNASGQLNLVNYVMNTYGFTYAQIRDSAYNSGNSQTITADATAVSRDILNAYEDKGSPLTVYLVTPKLRSSRLTFYINKTDGLPIGTSFNNGSGVNSATDNYVMTFVDLGKTYLNAPGVSNGTTMMQATAPGYTFKGWNTKADGTGTYCNGSDTINAESPGTFYAIWKANTYNITFDAGSGGVVSSYEADADAPEEGAVQKLTAAAVYDTKLDGGLTIGGASGQTYPTAWKAGYVFLGWTVSGSSSATCDSSTTLNKTTFGDALDAEKTGDDSALTLVAVYRKVEVTYVTDNGCWTDNDILKAVGGDKYDYTSDTLNYGDALPGLVRDETANVADYDLLNSVTVGTDAYAVKSTSSGYYQKNKTYVEKDYRLTIQRKGYTFTGWYTDEESADRAYDSARYGTIPAYEDITLYAGWKANSYTLTLYASKDGMTYENSKFVQKEGAPASGKTIKLTLMDEINSEYTVDYTNWPTRDQWYTCTKENTDPDNNRELLGFTFDPLDPGDSSNTNTGSKYSIYAEDVTRLINSNALFTGAEKSTAGSVFSLPDDMDYGSSVIAGTTVVPDYPTGSTIPMYAVYRERSLVFNEYYTDADGSVHQTVLATYPYKTWSNYADRYSNKMLENAGYSLIKWGVNGTGLDTAQYPTIKSCGTSSKAKSAYDDSVENWKQSAANSGAYDINVYTVYAAQIEVTAEQKLTATSDPQTTSYDSFTYTVPDSMQAGTIKYTLTAENGSAYNGFELVSKEEMAEHKYDSAYAKKIAVTVQVKNKNNQIVGSEVDLSAASTATELSSDSIEAGYKLTFTFYHSSVMTEEVEKSFALNLMFYNDGTSIEQSIKFDKITTKLVPSLYKVVYDADLPSTTAYDTDKVTWNDFSAEGKRTVSTAYGSDLLNTAAVVEGYSTDGNWYRTKEDGSTYTSSVSKAFGGKLDLPVSATDNGTIYLKAKRSIESYTLKLDKNTLSRWDVTINKTSTGETVSAAATNTVEYYSTVTFAPKSGTTQFAEMIGITPDPATAVTDTASITQLDLCATKSSGNYSFRMPAKDEAATYNDVWTLYLEEGTIDIEGDRVVQHKTSDDVTRTWHGDYVILMDADNNSDQSSTANTLNISGDLSSRNISLGNLNITSDNSIKLADNTNAVLTAKYEDKASIITAKNVQVPETAELTVNGAGTDKSSELQLTPSTSNYAAIGGVDAANGKIILKDLTLEAAMSAPSQASVVGPGSQSATGCGTVTVDNCAVTVKETSTASAAYSGTWIGGSGVSDTTVSDSTIVPAADSGVMKGPYVLRGTTVKVTDTAIGSDTAKITDPIYAEKTLVVDNSTVKQRIESQLGTTAAIGAGDTIEVTESTIDSVFSGSGSSDSLYTGTMKLNDAKSDVSIKGVHLADVKNGDITITSSAITQSGTVKHDHTGDYRILNSFSTYTGGTQVTVNSLSTGAKIEMDACTVKNMTVNADTPIILNGDVTVSETVAISSDKTLTVTAKNHALTFTGTTPLKDTSGTFKMEGGSIAAEGKDIGSDNLTIDLKDVTVGDTGTPVNSLIAKNLTLDGCTVNASGNVGSKGATGVTTVTIKGTSNISANIIGALGEQNSTFTLVDISDSFTFKGTLQRDLYRLNYNLDSAYKQPDQANPAVARVSEEHTTAAEYKAEDETMNPATLADAVLKSGSGTSSFYTWYILGASGDTTVPVAIKKTGTTASTMAGYDTYRGLAASDIAYAVDTDPEDGTKTLQIYADLGLDGTCSITSGKQLDGFNGSSTSVAVYGDGVWTADFTANGTLIANSSYQLVFGQALPANTMLTLIVEGSPDQEFYYKATGKETKVAFSDFKKMGTADQAPVLLSGAIGTTVNDHFTLVADFSQADADAVSDKTVKLQLVRGTGSTASGRDIGIQNLTYTLNKRLASTIEATGTNVTVHVAEDTELSGKELYLIAKVNNEGFSAPYISSATLSMGDTAYSGTWLGCNMLSFNLGTYEAGNKPYTYNISGLNTGSYQITWKLCYGDTDDTNTTNHILASASEATYDAIKAALPSLKVAVGDSNQKITAGTAKVFTVTTDAGKNVTAKVYELSGSTYKDAGSNATITSGSNAFNVTCSKPGTYRVEFSIEDSCMYDNVYYSFVVE